MENPLESVIRRARSGVTVDGAAGHEQLAGLLGALLGITLGAEDVRRHEDPADLARHIDDLRGGPPGLTASHDSGSAPASYGQRGIWFIDQYSPRPAAYNAPFVFTVKTPLDTGVLHESLRAVLARHEILRTTFTADGGEVFQQVNPDPAADFSTVELSAERPLDDVVAEVVDTEFDLGTGPLVKVVCAAEPDGPAHVVCSIHHIVFDAASAGVFLTEWFTRYHAALAGDPFDEGPARPQYRDFARRQRETVRDDKLDDLLGYWEERLAGPLPLLDLPTDRPRPLEQSHRGDIVRFDLPPALTEQVRALAADEGVTLFMLLEAAYAAFLHRHTRQDDVLIGSPVSLRDLPETAGMLGYFVNMVVFRHGVRAELPLRELYAQAGTEITEALRHKDAPFEKVIERVNPPRSPSHAPVFQTMFVLPDSDWAALDRLGLDADLDLYVSRSSKYDLSLIVEQDGTALRGVFEYDTALFDRETVEEFGDRYVRLLEALVAHPGGTVGELGLLSDTQEQEVLAWCAPPVEDTTRRPVAELFETQAAVTPDAPALEHGDRVLTYRELNGRANRLARDLRAKGVGRGDRVGIHVPRSPDMVVALLGVLKAGAAYVPVDPSYPAERIEYMLEDSGVALVLESADAEATDETDLGRLKTGDDEIYVIYTSGSTGRPKGVVLTEATVTNLVEYQRRTSPIGATGRTLQYMTLSFDVSVMEILGTLCAGGTLVLIDEDLQKDLHRLSGFLRDHRISRTYLPYVAVQQLAAVAEDKPFPDLVEVASVGEQLVITPQIRAFFARRPEIRFLNMYGPSETHLASAHELRGDPAGWPEAPSIGGPIGGLSMLALDDGGRLVPPGVPGELYLGGDLVSPGYHGLPEQTRERFVETPFGRLYRTGDLVRYDRRGEFDYLGRADTQIKIRGYRVEPAEVEAALNELPEVSASAVAPVTFGAGDRRLVGYLVTEREPDPVRVRAALAGTLPDYLVPSHFVRLAALPIAPSGKIDRKALPDLFDPGTTTASREPETPTEQAIAEAWTDLLGTGGVGLDEDFFAAGGHSILATELMYRLRKRFDVDVPLRVLFDNPTVGGMAARIDALRSGEDTGDRVDLRADVRLPDHVRVADGGPRATAEDVLLTGATGFLGIHLLRELLTETTGRVHCLVRATDADAAWDRIAATADRYGIGKSLDRDRVSAVPGDLAADRLGLSEADYDDLAHRVGTIHHTAAHINFVAPYASVKQANVDGLARIVEFAASGPVKPVHYTSTVAVFSPKPRPEAITEDDVPDDAHDLTIGYTQSKWVAEEVARLARDRGVPVTIYRIGRIAGDSETGALQSEDFLWRQVKSFLALGVVPPPEEHDTDLLPVDFVGRALVRLAKARPAENGTWHLFNPGIKTFDVVYEAIRELGYPLREIPVGEWRAALADRDNPLSAMAPLYQEGALDIGDNVYGNERTGRELARLGLCWPEITPAVFTKMIGYFRETGEFTG
ncbi:non-ribosomal peptide synthetase [Amycolatopsis sp. WQ 127309]|uniref:non-ribosomal peptide synthetase family protein n=1 Tax=Amycolatopsis sp. WQ 127309 TaxID=2932773 RepID=UPI001FF0E7D7|nr:non-ribosomal peptide synthetase [Amycolatopsis sp. WQ 127309]UOZ04347.1 amino acid adenylation domain-containing protein [Amycolatopsis sp. WQ 127309]